MSERWFRFVKGAIPSAAWDFSWLYDWGMIGTTSDFVIYFYIFDWVFGRG